jgi:hypothetical protein
MSLISGICRVAREICVPLRIYAAQNGNSLLTFLELLDP